MTQIIQQSNEDTLRKKLGEISSKQSEELLKTKAVSHGFGYIHLRGVVIPPEELQIIPEIDADRLRVICFYFKKFSAIKIACVEYTGEVQVLVKSLCEVHQTPAQIFLMSEDSFRIARMLYAQIPKRVEEKRIVISAEQLEQFQKEVTSFSEFERRVHGLDVSSSLALLLAMSLRVRASDVHLEQGEKEIRIRLRVDGILHEIAVLNTTQGSQIISRMKLISGMKINITDVPQDGHFDMRISGDKVDVRVSSLPTQYGESIALRILRSSAEQFSFDDLGMFPWIQELVWKEAQRSSGMFCIVGPTGSGKTTTLYGILQKINTEERKIITIEDPIEYELPGVNQSQVDEEHGYTFAKGLRSIVRQDPDVVLVGEIRDTETVDISLQSALTGHLVFSTLHSKDTASAVPRFLAMGAKQYLLAPALNAFLAQRLVRRVCDTCKESYELSPEDRARVEKHRTKLEPYFLKLGITNMQWVRGRGCSVCNNIGYRGRTAIFELFTKSPEAEKVVLSQTVSEMAMREVQEQQHMLSLFEDGILKALQGITTIEEVSRVVDE